MAGYEATHSDTYGSEQIVMAETYYCSRLDIENGLPTNWQGTLSNAQLDDCRQYGTNGCDSALVAYWPLPDSAASVPTPRLVQEAARLLALSRAWSILATVHHAEDDDSTDRCQREANAILDPIMKGERVLPRVTVTDENIALGSITLYPLEHVLAASPKTVVIPSVRIAGLVYGLHFDAVWRPELRSYMLRANDRASVVAVGKVSYEYTYLRKEEVEMPGPDYIRVVRA